MKRFSIAALMMVVLFCAVATAALRSASETWAGSLLLLTLLMLVSSLFGAIYRRGMRRAWWLGFAFFGWGYLVLAMGPWFAEQVAPKLPTTQLLGYLQERINPHASDRLVVELFESIRSTAAPPTAATGAPATASVVEVALTSGSTVRTTSGLDSLFRAVTLNNSADPERFGRIGHCLFALLAGAVGGLIAQVFQRTNREDMS